MIEKLLEIHETSEFDCNGYIELVAIEKIDTSLYLRFHICTGMDNEPIQLWKIACSESRTYQIKLGEYCEHFELLQDHVLLWSYNQPKLSLTFSHRNLELDIHHIIGRLHEKHFSLVDKWIPFDSYFNIYKHFSLAKLISSGHGKLAEGAEKIILGYQEVIDEFGINSFYLSSTPKLWVDDKGWIDEKGNAQILMFGSSYVVAYKFTAHKI
ncbi:MAG: hypothetical protein AAFO95_12245 [Cyanobacteria bacterium J06600_6]